MEKEIEIFDFSEEKEMFKKYNETKDQSIRNQIVIKNIPLAKNLASYYASLYKISRKITESYAYEGLCLAVDKFDPTLGNRFSTFAVYIIRGKIKSGVLESEKLGITGINRNILTFIHPYIKRVEKINATTLRENQNLEDEIIKVMLRENAITMDQCGFIKTFLKKLRINFLNDNLHIIDDGGIDEVLSKEIKKKLFESLDILKPKYKEIIILRYGLNGEEPKTQAEIGKMYGVTKSNISLMEQKALQILRESDDIKELSHYYFDDASFVNLGHSIYDEYDEETYNIEPIK